MNVGYRMEDVKLNLVSKNFKGGLLNILSNEAPFTTDDLM